MEYKTTTQRKREEKQTALLWLYVCSKGLLTDFKEFYRLHQTQTLEDIDREFNEILKEQSDGN